MLSQEQSVGYSYVTAQLNALCGEPATKQGKPEWFAADTVATLVHGRELSTFAGGNTASYMQEISNIFADAAIQLEDVQVTPGNAGSITIVFKGIVQHKDSAEPFSFTSVLAQAESKLAYYTVSETFVLSKVEVVEKPVPVAEAPATQAAEAPAEEPAAEEEEEEEEEENEPPTPPSPPTSPQQPAVPAATTTAAAEVKAPEAVAPAAPARPTSWAGVASRNKDAPVTAAAPPNPRPVAKAAVPAPKKAAEPRKEIRKVEVTATFKVQTPVSDAELRKAIPASLESALIGIRNQSEGELKRVWIEFSVADAVSRLNEAVFTLGGRTVTVESQRKKN